METLYYLAPLIGGSAIAFSPGVNNYIARTTKSVGFTLLLNFVLGTAILSALFLLFSGINLDTFKTAPLWIFLGGLYGTVTVAVMTITPARIGIGKTLAIFIAARLTSATVIENNGWLNMQYSPVTALQIAGIIVAIMGTFLVLRVKASKEHDKKLIALYYLLCLSSGVASSLQSSTNAALLALTDDMLLVSWLNFVENLACLLVFFMFYILFKKARFNLHQPKLIYLLGLCSALVSLTVISMMSIGSLKVGIANTVVLSILTQLAVGSVIDHNGWLKVAQHRFNIKSLSGLILLVSGAYLVVVY